MKVERKQVIEIVGIIAVVASLVFVGIELQQSQQELSNNRTLARVDLLNNVRSEISQYSEIWIKGNSGQDLTEAESVIYGNLIDNYWSQVSAVGQTARVLGRDVSTNFGIAEFVRFLSANPGARKYWMTQWTDRIEFSSSLSRTSDEDLSLQAIVFEHLENIGLEN